MNEVEVELATRMASAVPSPPDGSRWGGVARGRAKRMRRRRLAVGGGTTAAVLVVGILAVPALMGQDDGPAPAPAPDYTKVPGLKDGCPDPAMPLPYPPSGRVRSDPVGVRLCNVVGDPDEAEHSARPEELTVEPQGIVELVNDLPEHTGDACPSDAGPDVAVWFRYADGTAQAVLYSDYGCHLVKVDEDRPPRSGGELLFLALEAQLSAQVVADTSPDFGSAVTVENRTGELIWVILPNGNRASIENGKQVRMAGPCGYRPLRAETEDGAVLGYLDGTCRVETWTLTSTDPVAPDDPATSGTVEGRMVLTTAHGTRPVRHGGVTFEGPVTRTVSVDEQGNFTLRLPAGIYTVTGASSALPDGRSDSSCRSDEPLEVVVQVSTSTTVTCR